MRVSANSADAVKLNGDENVLTGKGLTPEEIAEKLYRYDSIAEKVPTLDEVGPKEYEQYKQLGYFAVDRALTDEEVNGAIEALRHMIFVDTKGAKLQFTKPQSELHTDEERELAIRKVYEYVGKDETLTAISRHPKLLKVVETILGEEPVLAQDMAILKPPHGGAEKPWHQDMAYGPLAYDKPVVGLWIALDPAELDNGCMHVIPKSHMTGAVPHYAVRDWQICDTNVLVERDVAVPLPPGGVLFFHGMLHHGTPPNESTKRRRALQLHYVGKSAVKLRPDEYKRFFTNEMSGAEC